MASGVICQSRNDDVKGKSDLPPAGETAAFASKRRDERRQRLELGARGKQEGGGVAKEFKGQLNASRRNTAQKRNVSVLNEGDCVAQRKARSAEGGGGSHGGRSFTGLCHGRLTRDKPKGAVKYSLSDVVSKGSKYFADLEERS